MGKRYYLSWFDQVFPERIAQILKEDLRDLKRLVMISGQPSADQSEQAQLIVEQWFGSANISFENNHLIDERISKEKAKQLIEEASVILLCGGYPIEQNKFLVEYELEQVIKKSQKPIIGVSAGAINLSSQWLYFSETGNQTGEPELVQGLGMDEWFFFSMANCDIENDLLMSQLRPISDQLPIYIAVNECMLRIDEEHLTVVGDVYRLDKQQRTKLKVSEVDR